MKSQEAARYFNYSVVQIITKKNMNGEILDTRG